MNKWKELCFEMESFDDGFYQTFNSEVKDFSSEKLDNAQITRGKDVIFGNWVVRFAEMYSSIKNFAIAAGPMFVDLSTAVSKGQEKVIALQDDLINSKDEQLAALQSTVKAEVAGVQAAVKTGFSSWSEIVQKKPSASPLMCPVELKKVIKSAVGEEDRSRNLMIFGKDDKNNEDVSEIVATILEDLDENAACSRMQKNWRSPTWQMQTD